MSKKFKGKSCVYCESGTSTTTGDHVFPRALFLENRRKNLPKVPCCKKCNYEKSQIELYITSILPLGGHHADALLNLSNHAKPRLDKNLSLKEKTRKSKTYSYFTNEYGILEPSFTISIDSAKIIKFFEYVTKALTFIHFKFKLNDDFIINVYFEHNQFENWLKNKYKNKIEENLGNGTITYKAIQANDNECLLAWEYIIYGGLSFSSLRPGNIVCYTIPKRLYDNITRNQKFLV